MNIIKKIFDIQRPYFERGKPLGFLKPLFEATETVFFIPKANAPHPPYTRDALDVKRYMSMVLVALMPPLFFGIYNAGYQSRLASDMSVSFGAVFYSGLKIVLPLILVSYIVGFFWETLFASVRKHSISEGLLVSGLLFPLTLPPTIPLWQVAVGMSFGIAVGKEIFGGTGRNIFNPALTGRAFLFFAYPSNMSGNVWVFTETATDAVSGATPLAVTSISPSLQTIEATLGQAGFSLKTLLIGLYPGSIGGTSALCCFAGALLLMVLGIAGYRIIIGGIVGLLAAGYILNGVAGTDSIAWFSINPFYHLVTGGFAFGIAYMATDPVSAPGTKTAKWIYGFCIGFLTVLIRVVNPAFPEGVMMAVLFMNLFAPLLDHIEINYRVRRRIPNV